MIHKVIVRAEARADIAEAYQWYEERSEALGLQFARATDDCLNLVSRNPNAYPRIYKQVHRALLVGFPFAVFFAVRNNTIAIIGCIHVRRSPKHWKSRA
jgi:plasmid stabilization system protein ParE